MEGTRQPAAESASAAQPGRFTAPINTSKTPARPAWHRRYAIRTLAASGLGLVVLSTLSPAAPGVSERTIKVFFRYDDFSEHSDTELEKQLIALFRQRRLKITFGVIPAARPHVHEPRHQAPLPLSLTKSQMLRDAQADGTVEVALHGYSHQTVPTIRFSEFRGLDLSSQRSRISSAKKLLEQNVGGSVNVFIPPWNSYDSTTVRVLEDLGFDALSADLGIAPPESRLKFVPVTCDAADMLKAVEQARRLAARSRIVGVLLHDYDFEECVRYRNRPGRDRRAITSLKRFADRLSWLARQPDIEVSSIKELVRSREDLGARRLLLNRPWLPLPPSHRLMVFISSDRASRYRFWKSVSASPIYVVLGWVTLVAVWGMMRLFPAQLLHVGRWTLRLGGPWGWWLVFSTMCATAWSAGALSASWSCWPH